MENRTLTVIRSPEDTAKEYQAYLRKYENDDKLVVLQAVDTAGSKPGDNYLSTVIRTKIIGTRGDGSLYDKAFMTKMIVRDSKITKMLDLSIVFRTEAEVYTKILPVLGPFGPSCVHADECMIIMEDLGEKGYAKCERRDLLDVDHAVFTLKKFAKLHALALAIKINNPRQFDELVINLKELFYSDNSETSMAKGFTDACITMILQYLDIVEPQTQEVQTVRDYFATNSSKTYDSIHQLFNVPKKKYDTICHGDLWNNNLLFLHDNDGGIIDLKMVDYQVTRYISVATDILYFIYGSVRSSVIERSFESLIKIYHNEFLNELRRSHVNEKILAELGMEWLQTELRNFSLFGVVCGCLLIHPMLAEEEDVRQFEVNGIDSNNPIYQPDMNSPANKKKIERVKCVASHYYRRFILGVINDDVEPISIME